MYCTIEATVIESVSGRCNPGLCSGRRGNCRACPLLATQHNNVSPIVEYEFHDLIKAGLLTFQFVSRHFTKATILIFIEIVNPANLYTIYCSYDLYLSVMVILLSVWLVTSYS
ncbi:hypothetical protein XENTR_v10020567 [Xenopus tropicalis]|nr:hypothetical protein XENTR_v10020567 [Xenopus tropicalis]